ncbi:MAG: phosphoesterase RecJ-like protein [Peptococcaceae bacterium]|jgi:phosphoesterase RecJ-like protein|nr:phosphoesterase RecJ-like protein [Peptococcaceae bacterium]
MSEWKTFYAHIRDKKKIYVLIHEKPDGDCLGTALGLSLFLKGLGYEAAILHPAPIPSVYTFLPGQQHLKLWKDVLPAHALYVCVDCADWERTGYPMPENPYVINIDHHVSNVYYGNLNLVETSAAATGEIVYKMLKSSGIVIDPEVATCLYVALITDTGSFSYSNTTAESLKIGSELVMMGANIDTIRQNLYEKRPFAELLIVKLSLNNLFLAANGKIIAAAISYEEMRAYDLLDADTDGLISMLRAVEGVEVALLLKEFTPGQIKVSLRSKLTCDVNLLAQKFGGGGHPRAAGFVTSGKINEVRDAVIKLIENTF